MTKFVVEFKREKDQTVTLKFERMSQGKAMALCRALRECAEGGSACANDVRYFLRNVIQQTGKTNEDQQLMDLLR